MNRHHPYREQIDACRPGSDDLSLPGLAELAAAADTDRAVAEELARSQRFDRAVAAAMHDVPLPDGLADRLLAKLAASSGDSPLESAGSLRLEQTVSAATSPALPSNNEAPANAATASRLPTTGVSRTHARRAWIGALVAAAAALLMAVGFWQWNGTGPRQISAVELAAAGSAWSQDTASANGWKPAVAPLPAFPLDRALVRGVGVAQAKRFRTALGEQAVAYQLTGGPKATLFVVKTPNEYMVATLPFTKLGNTTGRVTLAAWQRGDLLYVLAVDGDPRQLDALVRRPRITAIPLPFALPPA